MEDIKREPPLEDISSQNPDQQVFVAERTIHIKDDGQVEGRLASSDVVLSKEDAEKLKNVCARLGIEEKKKEGVFDNIHGEQFVKILTVVREDPVLKHYYEMAKGTESIRRSALGEDVSKGVKRGYVMNAMMDKLDNGNEVEKGLALRIRATIKDVLENKDGVESAVNTGIFKGLTGEQLLKVKELMFKTEYANLFAEYYNLSRIKLLKNSTSPEGTVHISQILNYMFNALGAGKGVGADHEMAKILESIVTRVK